MEAPEDPEKRLALSLQDRMQIDFNVIALQPRMGVAYVLCVFLGVLGAHRFYLGERQSGIIMLVLGITVIGLPVTALWAIVDLFLIPGMIRKRAQAIRERLVTEATG